MKLKTVSIILRPNSGQNSLEFLFELIHFFNQKKIKVFVQDREENKITNFLKTKKAHYKFTYLNEDKLFSQCSLCLVLGGDGTLLKACRYLKSHKIPIFSINMGRLGYISEFTRSESLKGLESFLQGNLETFTLPFFNVVVKHKDKTMTNGFFLNDAVISKMNISRMFFTNVYAGNEKVYHLAGDGLIVASPTGSTAYSLAAGGPIIHPEVKSLILTPICPHSVMKRPIVIPDTLEIKIEIIDRNLDLAMTLDGQTVISLKKDDEIIICSKNKKKVCFVKNPRKKIFGNVRHKIFLESD